MCLSYLICKIEVLTQAICSKIYKVLNSFPETQDLPSVSDSFYINTVFDKKVFGCCLVKDPPIISVWDPNSCPWDRGVWTWNLWTAGPAQASGSLVRGKHKWVIDRLEKKFRALKPLYLMTQAFFRVFHSCEVKSGRMGWVPPFLFPFWTNCWEYLELA